MLYRPNGYVARLNDRVYSPPNSPGHIPGVAQLQIPQAARQDNFSAQNAGYGGYAPQGMPRNDTQGSGNYLVRWLQQKVSRVLFRRFPALTLESGQAFPIQYDLQPGVASITQDLLEFVGEAKVLADEAFDIPLVDVSSSEDEYKLISVAAAFHFTLQQLEAAQFANVPLRDRKLFVARRVIAEKVNAVYAYGVPGFGFSGFLNNANIRVVSSTFNAYAASATKSDDLTDFFIDEIAQIFSDSLMTERASRWAIPVVLYTELLKTRIPNTNLNVLQYVLAALKAINPDFEIVPMNEIKSSLLELNGIQAPGTNKDRLVIYPSDAETVESHSTTVQTAPTEYRQMKYITPMYQKISPVMWQYTTGAAYVDLPKAA